MTLELTECTYSYRRWRPAVLQDLSYSLPSGLTILLGPNGAGKTTMLKLAAGVVQPSNGEVKLDSLTSRDRRFRQHVAWMPQSVVAMPSLSSREYVAYVGWLKGMSRQAAWEKAAQALTRVEMLEHQEVKTSRLSGGQLRRVGVAAALVHEAEILLLDEPTAGMDPRQRRVFRDVLKELSGEVGILMSTHDVADLAEESDHVAVMQAGRLAFAGSTADFLAHAPAEVAPGRTAEAAYTALSESYAV
ncbi:ABC transporter ATP-binding protein [Streptomyces sp. AS02]|uniref:ABC transporter ATP-binding protein n=1 Tax=Streptomyces sp. AS02 TaxID=2938946 RepID=UPI0020220CE9|nr:ATP-binding cassette domain-containing protein [Streptomyces sp. AS02]MCL8016718.1 ATP-binding cassette domain-containing protein [Streptomyces sp. AS02]